MHHVVLRIPHHHCRRSHCLHACQNHDTTPHIAPLCSYQDFLWGRREHRRIEPGGFSTSLRGWHYQFADKSDPWATAVYPFLRSHLLRNMDAATNACRGIWARSQPHQIGVKIGHCGRTPAMATPNAGPVMPECTSPVKYTMFAAATPKIVRYSGVNSKNTLSTKMPTLSLQYRVRFCQNG